MERYKIGTWVTIGKYEFLIISYKEYKIKGLKTGLPYNFTCDDVHETIKRIEEGKYELKFA